MALCYSSRLNLRSGEFRILVNHMGIQNFEKLNDLLCRRCFKFCFCVLFFLNFESFVIFADNWASQAQAVKRVRTMASQETVKQLEDCSVSKSVIFQETF